MEYTVNGLARLAGVSVRTLHWYDEIGLLRPARVTEAGYRMYGPDEVDALQSILFYRALGVPLKQIGALMADASAGRLAALQSHRAALLCRRAQLDALLATLDKTILTEEGKCAMTDAEKFEGFKQSIVAETERIRRRARGKYGDTADGCLQRELMGLSPSSTARCRSEPRGSTPLWPPRCARAKRRTGPRGGASPGCISSGCASLGPSTRPRHTSAWQKCMWRTNASLPTTTLKRRAARLFCGTRWRLSRAAETVRPQRPA